MSYDVTPKTCNFLSFEISIFLLRFFTSSNLAMQKAEVRASSSIHPCFGGVRSRSGCGASRRVERAVDEGKPRL